jgi:AraC-like DNA-binding protein
MLAEAEKVGFMGEFPDFRAKGFDIDVYNKRFLEGNVIIDTRAREVSYPQHWCPLSIKCAFKGTEFYQSNNALYAADENCYLLFNSGKMYSSWIDSEDEVESYTINIAPRFEREAAHTFSSSTVSLLDDPFNNKESSIKFTEKLYPHNNLISPILFQIRQLAKDPMNNKDELYEKFHYLLERLVQMQNRTNAEINSLRKFRPGTRIELYGRLTRAKDFIYSCYDREITLEQIAEVACLNQFYFLRQFKNAFQITPHQFLTERRLSAASAMLAKSDKPVSEICSDIGFSDPASFSKLFKRWYGISPIQFKRNKA